MRPSCAWDIVPLRNKSLSVDFRADKCRTFPTSSCPRTMNKEPENSGTDLNLARSKVVTPNNENQISDSSHETEDKQPLAFDDKRIFSKKEKWLIVCMIAFFGIFR